MLRNLNEHTAEVKEMAGTQKVAYIRVSTVEQNDARQREAMASHGIDRYFIDHASGKNMDRPQLQEMLKYIREGDTVYVSEFARLGRSTADLLQLVQQIQDSGAHLVSLKESFDTSTPAGKLQMTMLAAIAEFERAMILERQKEGIAIAKREGKYKGRKQVSIPNIGEYYDSYMRREKNKVQIAKELNISRNTLDRLFREYKK